MKCPHCKKAMRQVTSVMKEDGVEFAMHKCDCGEELLDMRQLKLLAEKYRKLRKAKDVTFAKWGNSIAVRIPKDVAEEFRITSGTSGILTKDKQGIRIIPT